MPTTSSTRFAQPCCVLEALDVFPFVWRIRTLGLEQVLHLHSTAWVEGDDESGPFTAPKNFPSLVPTLGACCSSFLVGQLAAYGGWKPPDKAECCPFKVCREPELELEVVLPCRGTKCAIRSVLRVAPLCPPQTGNTQFVSRCLAVLNPHHNRSIGKNSSTDAIMREEAKFRGRYGE